jgi:hypothetical protein
MIVGVRRRNRPAAPTRKGGKAAGVVLQSRVAVRTGSDHRVAAGLRERQCTGSELRSAKGDLHRERLSAFVPGRVSRPVGAFRERDRAPRPGMAARLRTQAGAPVSSGGGRHSRVVRGATPCAILRRRGRGAGPAVDGYRARIERGLSERPAGGWALPGSTGTATDSCVNPCLVHPEKPAPIIRPPDSYSTRNLTWLRRRGDAPGPGRPSPRRIGPGRDRTHARPDVPGLTRTADDGLRSHDPTNWPWPARLGTANIHRVHRREPAGSR